MRWALGSRMESGLEPGQKSPFGAVCDLATKVDWLRRSRGAAWRDFISCAMSPSSSRRWRPATLMMLVLGVHRSAALLPGHYCRLPRSLRVYQPRRPSLHLVVRASSRDDEEESEGSITSRSLGKERAADYGQASW